MEISSVGASEAKQASVLASRDLNDNFENFLKLLITQLQNQDPLDPMSTNEFTSQIVQFASVEQSIATNTNLEQLISLQRANQAAAAIGYLGKRIEASGDTTVLVDGLAEWNYSLPETADQVSLLVTDEEGLAVFHTQGATDKGAHEFVWDGQDDSGNPVAEGPYTLSVTATAEDGKKIATEMTVVGIVNGVETVGDEPVLFVGKTGIPISEVIAILDARRDQDREEQV
jgi:flagellar basal-body rod modification protein FlgD